MGFSSRRTSVLPARIAGDCISAPPARKRRRLAPAQLQAHYHWAGFNLATHAHRGPLCLILVQCSFLLSSSHPLQRTVYTAFWLSAISAQAGLISLLLARNEAIRNAAHCPASCVCRRQRPPSASPRLGAVHSGNVLSMSGPMPRDTGGAHSTWHRLTHRRVGDEQSETPGRDQGGEP